ncbi:MAG: hypothetical protein E7353_06120 [Clostridiales bacterium]|nr:hypothetical protein [Clostridiales bacterium]
MTENQRIQSLAENIFVFLSITILSFGKINLLSPFHYAFFYTSFLVGKSGIVGIVSLMLTAFYDGISFRELIFTSASLLPFVFEFVFTKTSKKEIPYFLKIIFCCLHFFINALSVIASIYLINLTVNAIVTLCFTFVFKLSYSLLKDGVKTHITDTTLGCMAFVFIAYGAGFSGIIIFSTPLLVLVAGFVILFLTCVLGKEYGIIGAISLGIGYAVCYYDVTFIATFGFCALCCVPFSSSKRIFPFLSALMGLTLFELYFEVEYIFLPKHLIFFTLGGLAFLILPASLISSVRLHKSAQSGGLALRYLINKNRADTAMQICRLREIFLQMSASLSFLKGDTEKVSLKLAQKIEEDVCKKCDNYRKCGKKELGNALLTLSRLTLIKNKATISSLPPLLENECTHLASLVGCAYNNSLAIRKDVARIATQNQVKSTLSQSLSDICDILYAQEKNIGAPLGFDYDREEKIKEELALCGVVCRQVFLSLCNDFEATLLIKRDTFDKNNVERAVSGALKIKSEITKVDDSVIKGWSIVCLKEKPVFSLIVSVASRPKSGEQSGDTHSFTALTDGCVMVALCDGMGSGERAGKVSENAISLIEDFYKAGFDHDVTLKSVNSFLRIDYDESFSALDAMVFDRKTGWVDIVKLASPPTYLKKSSKTIRIDASSLPLGIVNEVKPSVTRRETEDGDCFIFVTDGVYDCFEGDTLSSFINNSSGKNPSLLASAVLEEGLKRVKKPLDDMTVLVCKVIIDV